MLCSWGAGETCNGSPGYIHNVKKNLWEISFSRSSAHSIALVISSIHYDMSTLYMPSTVLDLRDPMAVKTDEVLTSWGDILRQ